MGKRCLFPLLISQFEAPISIRWFHEYNFRSIYRHILATVVLLPLFRGLL